MPCHDGIVEWPRFTTVLRFVIGCAALVGFGLVARQFWRAAKAQGVAEAARDARPSPRRTTTTEPVVTATTSVGAAAVATTLPGVTTPGATTTGPSSLEAGVVQIVSVAASAQAADATDSCQRSVSYAAINVRDNDPSTAWRAPGDASGATLTLTLAAPTHLGQVGLIPGYAKRDPCIDVDRFPQLRRITRARWTFDGGKSIEQKFQDRADLQSIPVDVTTKTVQLQILATTADEPQLDYTAISDVRLLGLPA